MATARSKLLPDHQVWTHCISRCVRRAFLCGERDGRFDNRRQWIADRLRELAGVFSVEIAAYAIMSNHIHVVLRMAPEATPSWSAREVAERWLSIFGRNAQRGQLGGSLAKAVERLAQDVGWIEIRRKRLSDLGWFMRALKEPIARRANAEDDCTGAFWEGRFASIPLLDQAALVACMAYVDLNPVRARIAPTPEASAHTAARLRVRARQRTRLVRRARERAPTPAAARDLASRAGVAPADQDHVARDPELDLPVARLARCVVRLDDVAAATPLTCEDYLTLDEYRQAMTSGS